jgi:hypothetical protein
LNSCTAEEFSPDRFLDDRLQTYLLKNNFQFLPYVLVVVIVAYLDISTGSMLDPASAWVNKYVLERSEIMRN